MSYQTTLNAEIDAVIDAKLAAGETLHPTWIAHHICAAHEPGLGDGEDADFWRHGGYRTCRDAVTQRIKRVAGIQMERSATQPTLPGFEHVQTHYVVTRDGEEIGVPTDFLTDAEIDEVAARIEAMGKTCIAHARELKRLKRLRSQAAA